MTNSITNKVKKIGAIYIIKNYINDKVYIGQTTMTVHERFMAHLKPCNSKMKRGYKLYNAIAQYGRDKFYVEVLEENVPFQELDIKEMNYIALYNSFYKGYNSTPGGDGRIINIINDEEEVLALAQSGMNTQELAKRYMVHTATILRTLHKLKFYYRKKIDKEEIEKLINEGKSNKYIADYLGVDTNTVSRQLDKVGLRKYNKKINFRDDIDIKALANDYYNQVPIEKICEKYRVTKTTLSRIRKKNNILNREQQYRKKVFDKDKYNIKGILHDIKNGLTKTDICRENGISTSTLDRILVQEGIQGNKTKTNLSLYEQELIEKIRVDYYLYMSITDICTKYSITQYKFEQLKKAAGLETRKTKYVSVKKEYDYTQSKSIICDYINGIKCEDICKKYDMRSSSKLYELLNKFNVPLVSSSFIQNIAYEERYDIDKMFEQYYSNVPINKILEEHGISIGIFYRIKKKQGLPNKERKLIHK